MQTQLASWIRDTDAGREADDILRRCVHCGFCLATCPTYQVLGDERDSPRGRIYLMKQVFEGAEVTQATQQHLDRCLTCRNCETTCPSGVQYGALVDLGRELVDRQVRRPLRQRLVRQGLRRLLLSPLFGPLFRVGRSMRGLMPATLRAKLPASRTLPARAASGPAPASHGAVLMLAGCVQPAMMPTIDQASIRVLAAVGLTVEFAAGAGCCGAIDFHLDAQDAARDRMRANIDAWLPWLESGRVQAIVMNASGCGAMVREYPHHLRHDPVYRERAERVAAHVCDIAEVLAPHAETLRARLRLDAPRVAFHPPCTLQHWQGLRGVSEQLLRDLGFDLQPFNESHLCCGSAGTYSVTQPSLSAALRTRKLGALHAVQPDTILSSNIGCITHLQSGTDTPVRHWIEVVDASLDRA